MAVVMLGAGEEVRGRGQVYVQSVSLDIHDHLENDRRRFGETVERRWSARYARRIVDRFSFAFAGGFPKTIYPPLFPGNSERRKVGGVVQVTD